MTTVLEDRLTASLHTQATRSGHPPAGLADSTIRRGRRLRRRRRAGALAGLAALLAGAAVVADVVGTGDRGLPDSYVTSVDSTTWAEGAPSRVPYMVGSLIVDGDRTDNLRWDGLEVRGLWETDRGYLVEASSGDSTSVLLHPVAGPATEELASPACRLVASPDGQRYAWTESDTGTVVIGVADDGSTQREPLGGLTVAGFLPDENGVPLDLLLQPRDGGQITVWDHSAGGEPQEIGWTGFAFDAAVTDLKLATIDGCVTAINARWVDLWQDCRLEPDVGAVAPDGGLVAAVVDGSSVVVKNAVTGADTGVITLTDAMVSDVRWENGEHVILSVTPSAGDARVARCVASTGGCEWAGPPPPTGQTDAYPSLVLGHSMDQ